MNHQNANDNEVFNIVYDAVFLVQANYGLGRHVWDVRAPDAITIAKAIALALPNEM